MSELYEVWVLDSQQSGWMPEQRRCDKSQVPDEVEYWEQHGHMVRVNPAPIMTADHWVEMGEV